MEKKQLRSILLVITYTIILVTLVVRFDWVADFVRSAFSVCRPLFLGFAIAFVLNRPCSFFARFFETRLPAAGRKAARPLAVLLSHLLLIGLIALIFAFVIPSLSSSIRTFVGGLSTYIDNLEHLYDRAVAFFDLESLGSIDLSAYSNALESLLKNAFNAVTSAVPQLLSTTIQLVSWVITLFLAVVFSFYLLASGPKLLAQCRRLTVTYLPGRISAAVLRVARLSADTFTNFVIGQVTEAAILGCLCFVGMTVFRFDYALLISTIIAVSAIVPIAGAYLGGGIACLLLVMIDPMQAVWFLVFLLVLQQLEGNIIYPRVVGTSIGLPGLWVLAAVTVGGGLFGFPGMLLGVPVTAVLYALLRDDMNRRTK